MNKVTINDLVELLEEVVDISGIEVNGCSILGEDIPIDSREMLRIISRVESRYRFHFKIKEIFGLKTLNDLLEIIRMRIDTS